MSNLIPGVATIKAAKKVAKKLPKSKVKGGRGTPPPRVKPTASKGQIHSAANKEKIDKAAKAANKRSKKANKYNPTKEEMFGSKTKRPSNFGEIGKRQKKDKDIDKSIKTVALKNGGGTYPPTQTEMESEFLDSLKPKTPPKPKPKPKTKTKKKMGGGKVYKYGQGGGLGKTKDKRISKNETNGNKIVDDCYKNYV